MAHVPTGIITHSQRVCRLYKKTVRLAQSWYTPRHVFRFNAILLRERFDQNKEIKDLRIARELLKSGEQELFEKQHPQPFTFANSPGGIAYGREVDLPDWVLDYWHPLEKAQYPDYFARREQRKKEYVIWWEKQYGKSQPKDGHH
ncbi:NADH dehydrogenase [ubiquinone] 1 beta subcomplex subunit 9 [Contarinia nasturtii]|uniref:NADH dehydrogenase [ubiquinone] 1 beta subcomplex subunit 9 n=1 Tax=Contarinia nasturtii TaxID=265458 RepID=UPI0012D42B1A|nr:NADH dehydrogenase [ubiquinone] 1 beta subcomplex subunit 9 [Contarinia nasturtii]